MHLLLASLFTGCAELPAYQEGDAQLAVFPSELSLSPDGSGTVLVSNGGTGTLELSQAAVAFSSGFDVSFQETDLAPEQTVAIQVRALGGDDFGYLRIVSNDPIQPIRLVSLEVESTGRHTP